MMVSLVEAFDLSMDKLDLHFLAYGDLNLFCTCSPVEGMEDMTGLKEKGTTGAAAPMPT